MTARYETNEEFLRRRKERRRQESSRVDPVEQAKRDRRSAGISAIEEQAQGFNRGLAETGTGLVRGAGWVAEKFGAEKTGRRMQDWATETEGDVDLFTGVRSGNTAVDAGGRQRGVVGNVVGRLAGEVAVSAAGGTAIGKGARRLAGGTSAVARPAQSVTRVLDRLDTMGPVGRATSRVAPFAPVDFLSGAGSPQVDDETGEERGFVLPGRVGSAAENVAMSFVPTVGFEAIGDVRRGMRESARFADATARQGREKAAMALVDAEKEAAELASAERASRRRAPLLLTAGEREPIITPPPDRSVSDLSGAVARAEDTVQRTIRKVGATARVSTPEEEVIRRFEDAVPTRPGFSPTTQSADIETPPQGWASRATPEEVDAYRLTRDKGLPPLRMRDGETVADYERRTRRVAGSREGTAERYAMQNELQGARTPSRTLRNVENIERDELGAELARLHDANAQENIAPTAIDTDYGEKWVGAKSGAAKASGRQAMRGKSIEKIEARMRAMGLDPAEELARHYERGGPLDFNFGDRAGAARVDLIAPAGGAVTGAAAGGTVGDTPEERLRNMAIGAAAGGGVGAITARVLGEAPSIRARGGVTRGQRGGYVGDPSYMVGARDFPRPIPKAEMDRLAATERRVQDATSGPIKIPAKPGTQSEVLRGEEMLAASGVSPDPLAKVRSERMPSDIARGNRVGAVGDLDKARRRAFNVETRRLQNAADAEGIEVRAEGRASTETLPSDPEINLGLLRDQDLDEMHMMAQRAVIGHAMGRKIPAEDLAMFEGDLAALSAERARRMPPEKASTGRGRSDPTHPSKHGFAWSDTTGDQGGWSRTVDNVDEHLVRASNRVPDISPEFPMTDPKTGRMLTAGQWNREADKGGYTLYRLDNETGEELSADWFPTRKAAIQSLKPRSGLKNRTGAVGDLDDVGGAKSPMLRDERTVPETLTDDEVDILAEDMDGIDDFGGRMGTTSRPNYELNEQIADFVESLRTDRPTKADLPERLNAYLKENRIRGKTAAAMREALSYASGGNRPGVVAPELLGAAGGAATGAATADSPEEALVNAAIGAGVGVAGVKAAKAAGKKSVTMKDGKVVNDLGTDAELVSGKPNRREKSGELFNKSAQRALDPAGYELWKNEEARAIKAGYKRTVVTDNSLREAAKIADIDAISLKDVGDLKDAEIIATANRIKADRAEYASLIERMEKGETSKEKWGELQKEMDDVLARLVASDTRFSQSGTEAGRRLRVFKMIMGDAAKAGKPDAIFKTARQVLGVKELGDDVLDALTGIMKKPGLSPKQRELELARAISGFMDKGPIEAILDIRRWGMLTAPATHAVNLTGNVAELGADKMIVTPIAAAIDRVIGKLSGQRSITGTGRYAGYGKGFTDEIKKIKSNFKDYFKGVDPEEPLAALRQQRANYVKSFGLDQEGAWRAALKPGAQVLQKAGDIVYGMMHVTDRPFMEAALQSSLAERSALRAAREGVKPGTDAFRKRVAELMQPSNVSETDATMAVMEAMDATFKTPTGLTAATHMLTQSEHGMARALGYGLKWAAPFTNTPANLIKKGLEATPGIGQVLTEVQARGLKKRLQKMGASKEEIGREVQRKRVTGAAKQIGTGAGLVGLGYLWTKLGMLRGEYVEPRAQSEAERDEAGVARLTGQGPLTLKIGDTAHSLSGFSQFAPLLALGHALAQSDSEQESDPDNQVSLGKRAWDVASTTAKSTLRTVKEMPMLQGMKNLSEIGDGVGKTVGREAASMIPFSSAIASAARVADPEEAREVKSFGDAVKERIPGARETLPSKVTPLGKVRGNAGPIEELISPTRPQRVIEGPVEQELIRLKVTPGMPRELPGEDRKAYLDRVKVEGSEVDQVLGRVIASPDYNQWPPPDWVQRAVENSSIWTDQTDKRTAQDKAKDALLRYMIRYVRTEQGKRRKGEGVEQ